MVGSRIRQRFHSTFQAIQLISVSFLSGTNPDTTAGQEGSTANGSELSSPDATDGDTSQSEAVIDELSESIKSEGDETLKDILDKNKEKKEVGARWMC